MKQNNYSIRKNTFNQKLFIDNKVTGNFDFPLLEYVKPVVVDILTSDLFSFNFLMSRNKNKGCVHFFIDDYQFERVWSNTDQYLERLQKLDVVITPDFSMYRDFPKILQIYNCWRSRCLARYFQKNKVNIVPCVSWGDENSYSYCFDGIAYNSAVAISSNGIFENEETKRYFLLGFKKMLETINPCQIICVGNVPKEIKETNNLVVVKSYGGLLNSKKSSKEVK